MPIKECELPKRPTGDLLKDYRKVKSMWEEKTPIQIALLAAAEEAYCGAASVLQPVLSEVLENFQLSPFTITSERLQTGLHLLEEGMKAHNRYMDSLK